MQPNTTENNPNQENEKLGTKEKLINWLKEQKQLGKILDWIFFVAVIILIMNTGNIIQEDHEKATKYIYTTFEEQACGYCQAQQTNDKNQINEIWKKIDEKTNNFNLDLNIKGER